jgi:hypothetical protein
MHGETLKYARHICPSYCHGRYMNNVTSCLHSILLSNFLFLFHSYFPSYTPIFLPFSLSPYSYSLFILVSSSFLLAFLRFFIYFCLQTSILFLFVYCLFSPFSIHRCSHSRYFRLQGRESELRSTNQQSRSSGLFTACYLTLDGLFRYANTEKVYESAN